MKPRIEKQDDDTCSHGMEVTGDCYRCEKDRRAYVTKLEADLAARTQERDELRLHNDTLTAECVVRVADCFRLSDELRESNDQNDALHAKMEALGYTPTDTCACSYEKHEHVCAVHSPQLLKAQTEISELHKERAEMRSAIRNLEFAVYNFDRKDGGLLWCCEFCEVTSKPFESGYMPDMEELPHTESCLWKQCR